MTWRISKVDGCPKIWTGTGCEAQTIMGALVSAFEVRDDVLTNRTTYRWYADDWPITVAWQWG